MKNYPFQQIMFLLHLISSYFQMKFSQNTKQKSYFPKSNSHPMSMSHLVIKFITVATNTTWGLNSKLCPMCSHVYIYTQLYISKNISFKYQFLNIFLSHAVDRSWRMRNYAQSIRQILFQGITKADSFQTKTLTSEGKGLTLGL